MRRLQDWLHEKWPTISGAVFGIAFVVVVAYFVLLPVLGTLPCMALWIATLVVLALWVWLHSTDGGAPSRVLSRPLQVERVAQRFGRQLTRALVVQDLTGDYKTRITVPIGFRTDYSSIPAPCRSIVHWSKVDIAGVVHDHLYREQGMSRRDDDNIWWLLARSGRWRADPIQAWLCWLALRGFGWTSRPGARQFELGWYLLTLLLGASVVVWGSRLICCVVDCAT